MWELDKDLRLNTLFIQPKMDESQSSFNLVVIKEEFQTALPKQNERRIYCYLVIKQKANPTFRLKLVNKSKTCLERITIAYTSNQKN